MSGPEQEIDVPTGTILPSNKEPFGPNNRADVDERAVEASDSAQRTAIEPDSQTAGQPEETGQAGAHGALPISGPEQEIDVPTGAILPSNEPLGPDNRAHVDERTVEQNQAAQILANERDYEWPAQAVSRPNGAAESPGQAVLAISGPEHDPVGATLSTDHPLLF
jgi:hypothetical protein